jgi:hypothetical protein
MMTERQRKFREQYVAQISPWYNGLLHVLVTYGVGIAAIAWCVSRMDAARWEWLLIVPVAIAGNFVEWGMHQHVMHRLVDRFAIRAIYDRHTRQHHQYFTDNDHVIHTVREFRIVFFPWRLLCVLGRRRLLGWLASLAWNANAGYVVFITMIGHYLVYETFHFCCHVPENWFVRNVPFINTIRRHHKAHHNMGIMMHVNMNLTFPSPTGRWARATSTAACWATSSTATTTAREGGAEARHGALPHRETQDERCTLDGPKLEAERSRPSATPSATRSARAPARAIMAALPPDQGRHHARLPDSALLAFTSLASRPPRTRRTPAPSSPRTTSRRSPSARWRNSASRRSATPPSAASSTRATAPCWWCR